MKRKLLLFMLLFLFTFLLVACGEETADDVLQSLNEKADEMNSYQATATMTMETGEEPQQFNVDIWHKKEDRKSTRLNSSHVAISYIYTLFLHVALPI